MLLTKVEGTCSPRIAGSTSARSPQEAAPRSADQSLDRRLHTLQTLSCSAVTRRDERCPRDGYLGRTTYGRPPTMNHPAPPAFDRQHSSNGQHNGNGNGEHHSHSSASPKRKSSSITADADAHSNKKRKKISQACLYCRRSHMTCDLERPCARCVKRDIGHLCHDEPRDPPRRSKSELGVQEIAPAPEERKTEEGDMRRSIGGASGGGCRRSMLGRTCLPWMA